MDLLSPYPSYPNPTSQQSPSDSRTHGSSPGRNLNLESFDSLSLGNTAPSVGNVNTEQYSSTEAEDRQRQFSALKEQQRTLKLLQEQRKREEELKAQSNSNSYLVPSTSYPSSNISLDKAPESIQPLSVSSGIFSSPSPPTLSYSILNSTPNTSISNSNSFRTGEQQSQFGSSIDTHLIEKLNHFMRAVESKLDGLDRQVQQLTLDFKLNNTKQERASDLLNGRLQELEDQIRTLKVSPPPTPISAPIHHSPSIPPYQTIEHPYKSPAPQNNTDRDEEFAKQLQAELDREAASSSGAPSSNPNPPSSTTYPNLGMYSPSSHVSTPGGPSSSSMINTDDGSGNGVNSCPICGIQLPVKQLHEHVEFQHFQNDNRGSNLQGSNVPNQDGKSPQNEGFFSKLFGGKKQNDAPQSSELRPPSYVYGQKPVPVQQIPSQPGSVPPGAVVPYGYPPYNPQALPPSQVVYRNVPPGSVPYYSGSVYAPK